MTNFQSFKKNNITFESLINIFMCRYSGKTYKRHYGCFRCRKSFKQSSLYDIRARLRKELTGISAGKSESILYRKEDARLKEAMDRMESRSVKCPECGSLMADLGYDFKAPKKTAVKEWSIIESLYRIGKSFYSCGCSGIGYIPQNENDYKEYLKEKLEKYRSRLAECRLMNETEFPDKQERVRYWSGKISILEKEMEFQDFTA